MECEHHVDIRGRKVKACNIWAYWSNGGVHVEGSDKLCETLDKVHSHFNLLGRRLHVLHKSSNFFIETGQTEGYERYISWRPRKLTTLICLLRPLEAKVGGVPYWPVLIHSRHRVVSGSLDSHYYSSSVKVSRPSCWSLTSLLRGSLTWFFLSGCMKTGVQRDVRRGSWKCPLHENSLVLF